MKCYICETKIIRGRDVFYWDKETAEPTHDDCLIREAEFSGDHKAAAGLFASQKSVTLPKG